MWKKAPYEMKTLVESENEEDETIRTGDDLISHSNKLIYLDATVEPNNGSY